MALIRNDNPPPLQHTHISVGKALITLCYLLITDIFLYGGIVPLTGAFIGGLSGRFVLPKWELLCVVIVTFMLMYFIFWLIGESSYWKHLFAFNTWYSSILQVRDVVNTLILLSCVVYLAITVEAMVVKDKGIKTEHVSEGVISVLLRWLYLSPSLFGIIDPLNTLSADEAGKFENGAAYMIYWAMLTACIAKLLYFNTLFTYLRAMQIFIEMNPTFPSDDFEDDASLSFQNVRNSPPSGLLENNFAQSIKNPNRKNK